MYGCEAVTHVCDYYIAVNGLYDICIKKLDFTELRNSGSNRWMQTGSIPHTHGEILLY